MPQPQTTWKNVAGIPVAVMDLAERGYAVCRRRGELAFVVHPDIRDDEVAALVAQYRDRASA